MVRLVLEDDRMVRILTQRQTGSSVNRLGLGEVVWSWLIYLAVVPPALVTYTRLPPLATYHFNATGFVDGGLSRMVTELNYPIAMAAIPLAAISFARIGGRTAGVVALLAVGLCLVAFVPGVVSVADLTARWVNAFAVVGCVIALGLSAAAVRLHGWALAPGRTDWDVLRLVLAAALAVWSVPWLFAAFGSYVSDAPLLGSVYRAHQPTPGEPGLASVHLGLHEGLAGTQMALTALLLSRTLPWLGSRPWLRATVSAYLGLLFCYGAIVSLNDGWNEQLVKRGTVDFQLPYLLTPKVELGWGVLLAASAAVHVLWFRREYLGGSDERERQAGPNGRIPQTLEHT
jgi:hypothetical protein